MAKRDTQPAIVGVSKSQPHIKHLVITISYADGADEVKSQFARWLASDQNEKLFKDFAHNRAIDTQNLDSSNRYKDLLKFLAA